MCDASRSAGVALRALEQLVDFDSIADAEFGRTTAAGHQVVAFGERASDCFFSLNNWQPLLIRPPDPTRLKRKNSKQIKSFNLKQIDERETSNSLHLIKCVFLRGDQLF